MVRFNSIEKWVKLEGSKTSFVSAGILGCVSLTDRLCSAVSPFISRLVMIVFLTSQTYCFYACTLVYLEVTLHPKGPRSVRVALQVGSGW
jgi:hypothetical protein